MLNYYTVASNHIYLLVVEGKEAETIPNSLQLMAGPTGQSYNQSKQRRGAVWEDRFGGGKRRACDLVSGL